MLNIVIFYTQGKIAVADEILTPEEIEYKLNAYTPENSTLQQLDISTDKNFDTWLKIIKHIIYYLKNLDEDIKNPIDGIMQAIEGAEERNQITECVASDITDCNNCVSNGIYYFPSNSGNIPVPDNNFIVYVASICGNDSPITQYAFNTNITNDTDKSVFYIRKGIRNESSNGVTGSGFTNWIELSTKKYVDTNFLNKVQTEPQTVNSTVTFNKNTVVKGNLTVNGHETVKKYIDFQETSTDTGVRLDRNANDFTAEVLNSPNNHGFNNMLDDYVDEYGPKTAYQVPLEIDIATEICNINGTANYANYVNPNNMVKDFKPENMTGYSKNYPVTGSALASLYTYCRDTYMPLSGGSFTGIVNHNEDIFLRYINDINSHRTAALRSPDGQLNLQCQQITNLISTTKQCEMYLEKEDVDSAEYTKKTASFTYDFYDVEWNLPYIRDYNREYSVTYDENADRNNVTLETNIGTIHLESNGRYTFIGTAETKRNINRNISYDIVLYYNIINRFDSSTSNSNDVSIIIENNEDTTGSTISYQNEYRFTVDSKSGNEFSNYVTINASHYEVVFTKSDFENLPIVKESNLKAGSTIANGSEISNGSVIDGFTFTNEKYATNTLFGTIVVPVTKTVQNENDETVDEVVDTVLANGSILLNGSYVMYGSIINGARQPFSSYINDGDKVIGDETVLAVGSIIKTDSFIAPGSVINGVEYEETTQINGHTVIKNAFIHSNSKLHIGSNIAPNSIINSTETDVYGIEIKSDSIINSGSMLIAGTFVSSGSIINNSIYENGVHIADNINITTDTKLLVGSFIKAGSVISGNSVINNITNNTKYTVIANYYNGLLKVADVAPKMYVSVYNNITDVHNSWYEYSFAKIHSGVEYDAEGIALWKSTLTDVISRLNTQNYYKEQIYNDLDRLLNFNQEELDYNKINDLYATLYNGKYTASKDAANNPQDVYDEYVYVSSTDRRIGITRIELEICDFKPYKKYTIYSSDNSSTITISPETNIFKYSDFVVRRQNNTYKITFNYMLAKPLNQYETGTQTFSEKIRFNFYGENQVIPFGQQERIISVDAKHMMNASCVIGARTRTGITKEGELGDPLYDLGCVDFGEEYTAIRLRKRNVTTLQNIKSDIAVILERNALKPEYIEYNDLTNGEIYKIFGITAINTFKINNVTYYISGLQIKNEMDDVISDIATAFVMNDVTYTIHNGYVTDGTNTYEIGSNNFTIVNGDNITSYYIDNEYVTDMTNQYPLYKNAFIIDSTLYKIENNKVKLVGGTQLINIIERNQCDIEGITYIVDLGGRRVYNDNIIYSITDNNTFEINSITYTIDGNTVVENKMIELIDNRFTIDDVIYILVDNQITYVEDGTTKYISIYNNKFALNGYTYSIKNVYTNYSIPINKSGMITLGTYDSKFNGVYLETSPIETSDKRKKTSIKEIPEKLLDAWKNVKWMTFKLKDSVEKKGKNARIHTGIIAQDLEKTLSKIDLTKYGFFCKDSWDNEYATKIVTVPRHLDEFGIMREEETKEVKVLKKVKGEQYSIRYQEMQAIENMYLRREIELLKEEIKALKEKIK